MAAQRGSAQILAASSHMRGLPVSLHNFIALAHSLAFQLAETKRKKKAGNHIALLTAEMVQHKASVKINFFNILLPLLV
jgi:hypothetical protein